MRTTGSGASLTARDSAPIMHRACSFLLAVSATSCAALAAVAQTPPRPPKPYEPVTITRPAALDDLTFALFRAPLAVAVKTGHYAELAPLVLERGIVAGFRSEEHTS